MECCPLVREGRGNVYCDRPCLPGSTSSPPAGTWSWLEAGWGGGSGRTGTPCRRTSAWPGYPARRESYRSLQPDHFSLSPTQIWSKQKLNDGKWLRETPWLRRIDWDWLTWDWSMATCWVGGGEVQSAVGRSVPGTEETEISEMKIILSLYLLWWFLSFVR